ncbi:TonB-dependent receptor [Phenylobacterium sp.]|uniref:TonB-dependent receptor n=1 Tax=Phenylobacterium sp. TaxID=1871053 RepID=UPI00286B72C5|nr:TonB-dependent receptor [Phenylobacterium sp.]
MNRYRKSLLIASVSAATIGLSGPVFAQVSTVDEVVVTGILASQRASIETKRSADAVVEALTAEDVGKFPDKNLAEALQRVPGIVINREYGEGERVSLRGTAPNLTRTSLNGHSLATADWFILDQQQATRSFNFLMLPSEIIGRIEVYKSPTAALEEGGVGGLIDVSTRHPLDLKPFYIGASLQGAYTQKSDNWSPQASGLISWKNADETFGVLAAVTRQEREIRRDGVEVLGYSDYTRPGGTVVSIPSLIGSALFQQERVRTGGNIAIQYKPSDAFEVELTGLISKFDADNFNQNFMAWGSNALGNPLGTLTNATIQNGTAVAGRITSAPGGRGVVFDAISRIARTNTRNIDLDVKWKPAEGWELHGKIGYTDAEGNTESQPFVEFAAPAAFDFDLRGGVPKVTYLNIDPTNPGQMIFDFASLHKITNDDSEFYVYGDAAREVEWGPVHTLRFGLKHTKHERSVDFQATTFGGFFMPLAAAGCGGACSARSFAGSVTPGDFLENIAVPGTLTRYFQVDRNKLNTILQGQPASVRARIPLYSEIFDVEEKTLGGYVLGEFGGDDWRGNVGVRVIKTEQAAGGYLQGAGPIVNPFGAFTRVDTDRSYTDVLPSLNIAFDLSEDLVVRFAAARTMARPDYTDIAPRVTLNVGALSGGGGNPDIDPYRANQFDVSLEWYPRADTILAASLYYKDIQSFITDRPVQERFQVETGTPNLTRCTAVGGGNPNLFNCLFDINRRANGGGGKLQGLELTAQAPIWNGFGVQTNYTYSDSETQSGDPLPGNSEHTFNLVGFYENEHITARLAYTYRSEFFVTFDRATPLNQDALESLDGSLAYNVNDNVTLTFDAINITEEKIVQYSGDASRPRGTYDNGRQFYAGVRLKF